MIVQPEPFQPFFPSPVAFSSCFSETKKGESDFLAVPMFTVVF
jgi:hypothetical protein